MCGERWNERWFVLIFASMINKEEKNNFKIIDANREMLN